MTESVKDALQYAAALILLKSFGWLPRFAAYPAAEIVAALGFRLARRQREAGIQNLRMAMPELRDDDRLAILRGTFSNLGRLLVEFSHFPRLNKHNISELVTYDGFEHYQNAVARGKGVLFLTAHFGSWELSCFAHSLFGNPMKFVVREIDNSRVEKLIESYRELAGNTPIDKRNASRDILRSLRNNETIGILVDQNTTRDEGVFVDFFGIPAATTPAVATFALRTGAAVVPGFLIWEAGTRKYRLQFDPPVDLISTGDPTRDIVENTRAFNRILENVIRRHPDQWLWIHRRWKTRPEGEPSLYE
ncbi:MAG TPA: lysophospholipid acyltransferase family protein [Terriglobia bacterium]|nr:lysophospholipid acyltransferase family protein [Terriglobia bacterium]